MRVGTISLNINTPDFNYGAMLHSWAFQQYLQKLDFIEHTEIIDYTMPLIEKQHRNMPIIDAVRHHRLKSFIKQIITFVPYQKRMKKFNRFVLDNLIVSREHFTQETLNNAQLPYDTVICESDVIWSPGFCGGHFDKSFFLALDSMRNMKRIAYAPSMADGNLNSGQEDEICEMLKYVDEISCRESYEKQILQKYTDKSVAHVLDPVMLLDAEDYNDITADRLIEKPYLLLYLPVDENRLLRECAAEYAKTKGLYIVEISTKQIKRSLSRNQITLTSAGIEEFLSAVRFADIVFTNSFHAICFSVIFERQFYAFSRSSAGKVKDICETLGVAERYFADDNFKEREDIDYTEINKKWMNMKLYSKEWLTEALKRDKA